MKIPNIKDNVLSPLVSLARIVSEDSQQGGRSPTERAKSSKDS